MYQCSLIVRRLCRLLAVTIPVAVCAVSLAADDPITIETVIEPATIPFGGEGICTVTIIGPYRLLRREAARGTDGRFGHTIDPSPDFTVTWLSLAERTEYVDGELTYYEIARYLLEPLKTGTLELGSAWTRARSEYARTPAKSVPVTRRQSGAPASSFKSRHPLVPGGGEISITASVDRTDPYIGQQITYRVDHLDNVFDTEAEYHEPLTDGFWAVDLPDTEGKRVTRDDGEYWLSSHRRALFPTNAGELSIGEAILFYSATKGTTNQYGRLEAPGLTVTAKRLPENGKPTDFAGAVGRFGLSAQPDAESVGVEGTVIIQVVLSGTGNLDLVTDVISPPLENFMLRDIRANEVVRHIENETVGGSRIWEYVLEAEKSGPVDIGAFTLSYFDPAAEVYRTAKSKPFRIVVTPRASASIEMEPGLGASGPVRRLGTDIRFLKPDRARLESGSRKTYNYWWFPLLFLGPSVILAGGIAAHRRHKRLSRDPGRERRINALKRADRSFDDARNALKHGDDRRVCALIGTTIDTFAADMTGTAPGILPTRELIQLLRERGISQEHADHLLEIVGRCDTAIYAPGALEGALRPLITQARGLIQHIHRHLITHSPTP
jgi:hypothetical protein